VTDEEDRRKRVEKRDSRTAMRAVDDRHAASGRELYPVRRGAETSNEVSIYHESGNLGDIL